MERISFCLASGVMLRSHCFSSAITGLIGGLARERERGAMIREPLCRLPFWSQTSSSISLHSSAAVDYPLEVCRAEKTGDYQQRLDLLSSHFSNFCPHSDSHLGLFSSALGFPPSILSRLNPSHLDNSLNRQRCFLVPGFSTAATRSFPWVWVLYWKLRTGSFLPWL